MDLHDYEDVARNYDEYLKSFGRKDDSKFINYYLSLCEKYGDGGIIDIACGTGILTIPIAKKGYQIIATDISKHMIKRTNDKLKNEGLAIHTFIGNMMDFNINKRFSLAIIARGGFMHLTTPEDQRKALNNIRTHLIKDGILTLNTFEPNIEMQYKQINTSPDDYTIRSEYINAEGKREKIYNAIGYDPKTQIMSGNWKFETLDKNNNVIDVRIRPLKMRQTYKIEMEYLCELCGFKILDASSNKGTGAELIWSLQKS